jgi:hypothetical protein
MTYVDAHCHFKQRVFEHSSCSQDEVNAVTMYVSDATEELGLLGMTHLFLKSYSNNKLLNINGLLCYDGHRYGMIVEGERNNILYKNQINQINSKRFNNWTMKFRGAEAIARVMPSFADSLAEIGDGKADSIKQLMSLYEV